MTLSWQPSDPIYQRLDTVSALCCFGEFFKLFNSPNDHTFAVPQKPPGVERKEQEEEKKQLRKGLFGSSRRGPWKNHCRVDLAGEREVTLVLLLHRVITAAALCLFSTGCDTDGFDRRGAQS